MLGFAVSLVLIFALVRDEDDSGLVLLSLLCSGVVASGFAYWQVRKEMTGATLGIKQGVKLIRESSTVFLYTGTSALLVASSTYLLSILSTSAEVGSFGAAERLIAVGLSVMGPAGQIFVPKITALFVKDVDGAHALIRKAFLLIFAIGLAGLLCSVVLGPGWCQSFSAQVLRTACRCCS